MEVVTRKEALSQGLKRYYTGRPCKHGHFSERLVSSGCITCNKLKNKNRVKNLYANDVEFVQKERLRKRESYRRNADFYRKKKKMWRKTNPVEYFARKTLDRLESNYKLDKDKFKEVLGYTSKDFKVHIESLWLKGMSWENRSDWHIDHIKPLSLFIKEGITDIKVINSLDNLQPLWALDNLKKGSSY